KESLLGLAFSPDGQLLASAGGLSEQINNGRIIGEVKVWEVASGRPLHSLRAHPDGYATSICFSPDSKRLLTGGADPDARVWDVQTGQELLALKGHAGGVLSVSFSPDGQRAVTGGGDPDPESHKIPAALKVWDADSGQEVLTLPAHTGGVTGVCFDPDGKRLASAGAGTWRTAGEIKLWDAAIELTIAARPGLV